MSKRNQHVVPDIRGGWSVRSAGASRATRIFDRQADAVEYARDVAKKSRGELYVHGRDGRITRKDSYSTGSSPHPPKK
ncbi:MAG: DUF2188 domain-containing protein [Planctomycetes bacterium]|nr:DUF2188 domain-containing protein [Planctomycetota bacterium]